MNSMCRVVSLFTALSVHLSPTEEGSIHLPTDVCPTCLADKSVVSSKLSLNLPN